MVWDTSFETQIFVWSLNYFLKNWRTLLGFLFSPSIFISLGLQLLTVCWKKPWYSNSHANHWLLQQCGRDHKPPKIVRHHFLLLSQYPLKENTRGRETNGNMGKNKGPQQHEERDEGWGWHSERGSVMTSDAINQLDGVLQESGFSSH